MRVVSFLLAPALLCSAGEGTPEAIAILKRTQQRLKGISLQYQRHVEGGQDPRQFRADAAPALKEIEADLSAAPGPDALEALLVSKLVFSRMLVPLPKDLNALAAKVRSEVSAPSRAWGLDPDLFLKLASPAMQEQAMQFNPDAGLRAKVMSTRAVAAAREGRLDYAQDLVAKLQRELPKEPDTALARETVEAWLVTAPGRVAPAFQLASLEDRKLVYTPEAFRGKYLLIDFWASWCGPCRSEMPLLHQAWAQFRDKNLEILSLSFDESTADIAKFRQQPATPMPWKHAFVPSGFDHAVAKAYGVKGIPKPVLVGPDGKILISGDNLRGEDLLAVLKRYLESGPQVGQ